MHYLYLSIAIAVEILGTALLKVSDGFSKLWPSVGVLLSYSTAIFFLSLAVKVIPVGVAYAIWSGVGVAMITLISWVIFDQELTPGALLGIGLIVVGVVVLQVFGGESAAHGSG